MGHSKETNYNSKHRTNYPFEYEQQKVLKIFKCIKQSSSSDITYGKFTSLWYKKHISDFFIGAFKVALLCGGGNISDKELQAYMKNIFDKYFSLWGDFSIEALDAELLKLPQVYNIKLTPDKKEIMDSKKMYIKCVEDDFKIGKKYLLLRRRKSKPARVVFSTNSLEKIYNEIDKYIQKDIEKQIANSKEMLENGYVSENDNLKHYDRATEREMAFKVFEQYQINARRFPNANKHSRLVEIKKLYKKMYPEMGRGLGKKNDPYFQKLCSEYREYIQEKQKATTISTAEN